MAGEYNSMDVCEHFVSEQQLEIALGVADDDEKQNRIFQSIAGEQWHILLKQKRYDDAILLWKGVLSRTTNWEYNAGKRVHKGTPFYFLAVTCLLAGGWEQGFLFMHKALAEDIITSGDHTPATPAWKFVTLDSQSCNQFAFPLVSILAAWVEATLGVYRNLTGFALSFDEFSVRFLRQNCLRNQVFTFVHEAFEIKELTRTSSLLDFKSGFGSFRLASRIFALCLVVDAVIDQRTDVGPKFINKAAELASRAGMNIDKPIFCRFNDQFQTAFYQTVTTLLCPADHRRDTNQFTVIERDLILTYGFRNFAAHRIEEQPVIVDNFEPIIQAVMNTLFCAVEKLY